MSKELFTFIKCNLLNENPKYQSPSCYKRTRNFKFTAMKKTILITLLILIAFLFSCMNNGNYKKIAVNYLKNHIDDTTGFDTIEVKSPDTVFTSYYRTKDFDHMSSEFKLYNSLSELEYNKSINSDIPSEKLERINKMTQYHNSADSVWKIVGEKAKLFKKEFEEWNVKVIYRLSNKLGLPTTDTANCIMNKRLTKIDTLEF